MIAGIGTDLCRNARMEKGLASPAFLRRVYGPVERAMLDGRTGIARLSGAAANFAAKEAFLKAAGVGIGAFAMADIQVLRRESGAPYYRLSGTAAQFLADRGLAAHLSLTHEGEYALAFAVLETV